MICHVGTELNNTVVIGAHGVRRAYSPYGVCFGCSRSVPAFNGELKEPFPGGYLLGNGRRMFRPGASRFVMPDPRSPFREGGINAYAYCFADPVNRTDPSGHVSISVLAKHIVWWGARLKALVTGSRGVQRFKEAAKWGKYVGGALASVGVPGAGTLAAISDYTGLAIKGAQTARQLWGAVNSPAPRMAVGTSARASRRLSTGIVETGFAGSLGQMITDTPVDNSEFSPYVGDLLPRR